MPPIEVSDAVMHIPLNTINGVVHSTRKNLPNSPPHELLPFLKRTLGPMHYPILISTLTLMLTVIHGEQGSDKIPPKLKAPNPTNNIFTAH
jgi:hypothetical protein